MDIIALQYDVAWEDKQANHQKVQELVAANPINPGSLLILPEMFDTGFSFNTGNTAESNDGPSHVFLKDLAQQKSIYIHAGLTYRPEQGQCQNQAVTINPQGEIIHRYTKIHTFTPGGETDCFEQGRTVSPYQINDFTICPFVCYDLRFPEIFRMAMNVPTDFFTVIASWPAKRKDHWLSLLKARAIENQAYVLGLNRIGTDEYHAYDGHSILFNPKGECIVSLENNEAILQAQIEKNTLIEARQKFPVLKDKQF